MIYYITKYKFPDENEISIFIEKKLDSYEMGVADISYNLCKINLPDHLLNEIEEDNNCRILEKEFLELL